MVRSAQRVSNHEGSRRRDRGTASWFETAFGLLTMRLLSRRPPAKPLGTEACDVVSVRDAGDKERAAYDDL
ncbi:protein of unknown function [Beijerinckiaceae bacterium RH AL1]|nr:protein of unknown function [Beijerinckiaceae bacterium RH CH11]VVB49414.1 protein of unknown function [Beijerinckiaceae bacterium RH AL8]VVC56848.1 protein of unknown function [Beijerinckiaceae bacterium RH AL1]